ncbi:hypothetical protein ACHAWO_011991 [Cyclotella atomus]|uniref:DNA replication factor Cdt1 C-terminal domain-containing protein n=1 Tax=Cyclotella atomus TaxID=382360 RepID=A0ABD3QCE4_9STRA
MAKSPSNYELLRLQRIERNNERLKTLGLLDKPKPTKAARTPPKKAKKTVLVSPSPRRASRRLQNQPAPTSILIEEPRTKTTVHRPRPRPRRIIEEIIPSLSDEQKQILSSKVAQAEFVDKLQHFLTDVHQISASNLARVLRSITKLSSGEGVRAPQWPENCHFLKGEVVSITSDVHELIERGRECEEEWGRDLGNGWLYNHPLRKLRLFQSYLLGDE